MSPMTRRQLFGLLGIAGVAVLGAAGVGSAVAALADRPGRDQPSAISPSPAPDATNAPPAELVAALQREQQLLATIAAMTAAGPATALLPQLAADHQAHSVALLAAMGRPQAPLPSPSGPAPAHTTDQLKAAEQAAQLAAVTAAATLPATTAVLLASIAACEAGHVELLS
jgi:hypothetical protein